MESTAARIPEPWVNPVRAFTALIVLLHVALFVMAIPARYAELTQPCALGLCKPLVPTPADVAALDATGLTLPFYATFHVGIEVVFLIVSLLLIGVLFWRASSLWIGNVAMLGMVAIATFGPNVIYALGGSYPELYPLLIFLGSVSMPCMIMVFYLFPDGRFYPRWALIAALILIPVGTVANVATGFTGQFTATSASTPPALLALTGIMLIGSLLLGFVTQIVRYRRHYDASQKQQARWLIAACGGLIVSILLWLVIFESPLIPPGPLRIVVSFVGITYEIFFGLGLLHYALVIAILRYRLWDIDLIIRRTVTYSAITALLAGMYFGAVTLLQSLFAGLISSQSPLAIVISTLAIAALFTPVRRRVQGFVDRRFNRRRYNAEQTLEAFAEAMRDDVELDHLSAALVNVVEETMQPESVSVWLLPPHRDS